MKKLLYSLSIVIAIVVYTVSCTKIRTTELGSGLIPAVDNVNVFDTTLDVVTTLYSLPDSTRIISGSDHAVGIMEDPSFGKTTGEMYFQLLPQLFGTYPFGFSRDSLIGLDSVVLSLRFKSVYGDTNSIQSLKVYEIDQSAPFRDSSLGYLMSHPSFAVTDLLAEQNVLFSALNDSLMYLKSNDTVLTVNELRIKLPNSFGMRLMDYDTTIYKTDSAFNTHFKGFAMKADEGSAIRRALAYFNLSDAGTRLSFHYRTTKSAKPDTTVTEFILRNRANANLVKRDPTGSPYGDRLVNGFNNQEELYLQSSPGSYALVQVPGLQNLNNRVIYKAVLQADRLEGIDDGHFTEPSLLFLDAADSANNRFITVPNSFVFQSNSAPYYYDPGAFGGFLLNNRFEFDLASYVQGIVTRKEKSFALRMYAPYYTRPVIPVVGDGQIGLQINGTIARGRVVISGGAHPTKKMRLYIVYSKL